MDEIYVGRADLDAPAEKGWLLGHFQPPDDPRHSTDVEIKWGRHPKGERRARWVRGEQRTALLILISGRFHMEFPDRTVVLTTPGDYVVWPGPNSNTFVAHVMRSVPELSAALPPTALGKDWQPWRDIVGLTPSRTGIQISLGGYAGLALGWVEGLEIDFMGLVAGIDVRRPAVKIPAWGRFGMDPITW